MTRRPEVLASYGAHGARVRVIRRREGGEGGTTKLVAEWYVRGVRREKSWADTRANLRLAKTWAETFAEERLRPRTAPAAAGALTNRALWDLYSAVELKRKRPRTQRLYAEAWRRWELFTGRDFLPEHLTPLLCHQFRAALERAGLGVNSVRQVIGNLKIIFAWAEREEVITRNRWRLYRLTVAKDEQPESPPEYTDAEYEAVLAELDPTKATEWRAWVALVLLGGQGVRQVAGLQLKWTDLRLTERGIEWPAATDKNGKAWFQPLAKTTVRALRVARTWARRRGIESPYVLPAGHSRNRQGYYTAQSLWAALTAAETRAGVPHRKGRAAHGLRRLRAGNVMKVTGNFLLGLWAIGDKDPKMAARYLKQRRPEVAAAFRKLDRRQARAGTPRPPVGIPERRAPAPERP